MSVVQLFPNTVLTVFVQGTDDTHRFADLGYDMTTGLYLPNGWQNRCQAITRAGWWCSNPVLPKTAWRADSTTPWWFAMTESGFARMESMRCHSHHREAAS